jgi:hypothetical protein
MSVFDENICWGCGAAIPGAPQVYYCTACKRMGPLHVQCQPYESEVPVEVFQGDLEEDRCRQRIEKLVRRNADPQTLARALSALRRARTDSSRLSVTTT